MTSVQVPRKDGAPQSRTGKGTFWIGTSGYQYPHWRGVFYPCELPRRRWLEHYASRFATVEINTTFYRLPKPEVVDAWRDQTPDGFRFALKYSRFGTHMRRLREPRAHLEPFLECALRLGPKLGPVLVQLPPRWNANADRLAGFLAELPTDLRVALEFRDPSWLSEEIYAVLRAHSAALCVHDALDRHSRETTASWAYMRFHGPCADYRGRYSRQKLSALARWIASRLAEGLDVHAYFNNDAGADAVHDASDLRRFVAARTRATGTP